MYRSAVQTLHVSCVAGVVDVVGIVDVVGVVDVVVTGPSWKRVHPFLQQSNLVKFIGHAFVIIVFTL
jgi:hypothetical protein